MPRPRKPAHLKIISGTARKDREAPPPVKLATLDAVPDPPEWLNERAANEWRRVAPILVANKLLTEAGLGPLAMLCAVTGALARTWAAGEAPKSSLIEAHRGLVGDFGLTPAGAARIRHSHEGQQPNRFARNGKR
jgi:hypothetical protein